MTYQLNTLQTPTLTHFDHVTYLLGDHAPTSPEDSSTQATDRTMLRVAIRSGDYFSTLATRLDNISQQLHGDNQPEHDNLQTVIDELLYIDTHYQLREQD